MENEGTLFYKNTLKPKYAVTGTRGKTTTTNWLAHFLSSQYKTQATGNSPKNPFLKAIAKDKTTDVYTTELSSFILELFEGNVPAPDISILTNLHNDHTIWHGNLPKYFAAKTNIYKYQTKNQKIIINADDVNSLRLIKKVKPKGEIFFFSAGKLGKYKQGVEVKRGKARLKLKNSTSEIFTVKSFNKIWGEHNLYNCLAAGLAAYLGGVKLKNIKARIKTLSGVEFRQQLIFKNKHLMVYNDTTATTPEGCLAAAKHFSGKFTILICGGTDRGLVYKKWGEEILKYIQPQNLILLSGSATDKMLRALGKQRKQAVICNTLEECLNEAVKLAKHFHKVSIVFSPGAKSFEKFRDEYDRGEKFNSLIQTLNHDTRISLPNTMREKPRGTKRS